MCGHISFFNTERLYERYDVQPKQKLQASYNTYVNGLAPVINNQIVSEKKFGFQVSWSKKPIFNAKIETAHLKKNFQKGLLQSRCIIPASRYFEWQDRGSNLKKIEYWHQLKDQNIMSLAGIYRDEEFVILTTKSWPKLEHIHPRMPLILQPKNEKLWLDPDVITIDQIQTLLNPLPFNNLTFNSNN